MRPTLRHIDKKGDLEKQLEIALNKLEEKEKELEKFVYIVSHDLKQPINAIGSLSSLLKAQLGEDLTSETKECLSLISQCNANLHQLIDALLIYSRLGRNLTFEKVDLNVIVSEVKSKIVEEREVDFDLIIDDLPTIDGLRKELGQLFYHLIDNALKFVGEGVKPKIKIACKELDDCYEMLIIDNGISIENKFKERIFEVFTQLHSYGTYPGVGIGLPLCKKVMELHDGDVYLKKADISGSIFSLIFYK